MSARQDRSTPGSTPGPVAALHARLAAVLTDLEFPAQRWQVLTVADLYGVDTLTRTALERLPERRYHGMSEVVGVLAAVLAGRPVTTVAPPTPPLGVATERRPAPVPVDPTRPAAVPVTPVA